MFKLLIFCASLGSPEEEGVHLSPEGRAMIDAIATSPFPQQQYEKTTLNLATDRYGVTIITPEAIDIIFPLAPSGYLLIEPSVVQSWPDDVFTRVVNVALEVEENRERLERLRNGEYLRNIELEELRLDLEMNMYKLCERTPETLRQGKKPEVSSGTREIVDLVSEPSPAKTHPPQIDLTSEPSPAKTHPQPEQEVPRQRFVPVEAPVPPRPPIFIPKTRDDVLTLTLSQYRLLTDHIQRSKAPLVRACVDRGFLDSFGHLYAQRLPAAKRPPHYQGNFTERVDKEATYLVVALAQPENIPADVESAMRLSNEEFHAIKTYVEGQGNYILKGYIKALSNVRMQKTAASDGDQRAVQKLLDELITQQNNLLNMINEPPPVQHQQFIPCDPPTDQDLPPPELDMSFEMGLQDYIRDTIPESVDDVCDPRKVDDYTMEAIAQLLPDELRPKVFHLRNGDFQEKHAQYRHDLQNVFNELRSPPRSPAGERTFNSDLEDHVFSRESYFRFFEKHFSHFHFVFN